MAQIALTKVTVVGRPILRWSAFDASTSSDSASWALGDPKAALTSVKVLANPAPVDNSRIALTNVGVIGNQPPATTMIRTASDSSISADQATDQEIDTSDEINDLSTSSDEVTTLLAISRTVTVADSSSSSDSIMSSIPVIFASDQSTSSDSLQTFLLVATRTGKLKRWNGTAWVEHPLKYWNGTAWVAKPIKAWNGSAWITAGSPGGVVVPTPAAPFPDSGVFPDSGRLLRI